MLTIRLTRKGKKNQPFFRVVVVEKKRSSKGGRATEDLGYKNPLTKKVSINKERALYWISKGAQPSPSVHNLLIAEKIIVPTGIRSRILDKIGNGKKINVSKKSKKVANPAEQGTPVATSVPEVKPAETPVEAKPPAAPEVSGASLAPSEREEPKPVA